jgi:hypothetical protein
LNEKGKQTPIKVGLKEITREGFEYELTLNLNLDEKHNCTASKDRTGLFMGKPFFTITEETGVLIRDWCEKGLDKPKPTITEIQLSNCIKRIENGESGVIEKVLESFELTTEQHQKLTNV